VDQHGIVLDILVTSRRNAKAATRFLRKLLKGLQYVPRVLVTDKLASYGVARRRVMPGVEHRRSKYLKQSGGELPPTHPPARTGHKKVPLTGRRAAVPVGVQRDITALSAPPTQTHRSRLPPRDGHPIHRLERGRRRARSRLTPVAAEPHPG
jgi:hypothetical protein